jgi:hypothetical protein
LAQVLLATRLERIQPKGLKLKLIKYVHRIVTQGDWGVSCTTGSGINGAILHVYRSHIGATNLPFDKWFHGFGDGRLFETEAMAWQFAYDHGYLQLYFTSPELRQRRKQQARDPRQEKGYLKMMGVA